MGLEEIQADILDQAKHDVQAIQAETKEALAKIDREVQTFIAGLQKKHKAELKIQEEKLKKVKEAEAETESKQVILNKKQQLINIAFEHALELIEKDSRKYVPRLIAKARTEMPVAKVYCNNKDIVTVQGVSVLAADVQGIIAENKEGTISIDLTYKTLLDGLKEKKLHEVAKVLFP